MKYYSSWQLALVDYVMQHGHEFEHSYSLFEEFEHHLKQNRKGAYFISTKRRL